MFAWIDSVRVRRSGFKYNTSSCQIGPIRLMIEYGNTKAKKHGSYKVVTTLGPLCSIFPSMETAKIAAEQFAQRVMELVVEDMGGKIEWHK